MERNGVEEPVAKRSKAQTTTLFLVRHGDRWDFANKALWKAAAKQHGFEERDPPLSAIGHEQARSAAKVLSEQDIDVILASPYLRVLQTAQPLAHASGLHINIEDGLSEAHHVVGSIASPADRFPFFPEVDLSYEPLHTVLASGVDGMGRPAEDFPGAYLQRQILMAKLLPRRYSGKCVACFSHAASLAVVAALTGKSLSEVGNFAPAGIFKLTSHDGTSWVLEAHGSDNSGHVTRNNPKTFPWGFKHCSEVKSNDSKNLNGDGTEVTTEEVIDSWWQQAKERSLEDTPL